MLSAALAAAQQTPAAEHGQPTGADQAGAGAVHPGGSAERPEQPVDDGMAHAEEAAKHGEGHAEAPMPNEIWWKWANFALLAVGLGYLIKKFAGPFFTDRTYAIQSGIREASAVRADAEARAADIERRVSNLSLEVVDMREKARAEMQREAERIRLETGTAIRKVQAQAEAEIASAAKHATGELRRSAALLALGAAEAQIRARMTPESQREMVDSFGAAIRQNPESH
jgi:F0F1-type ATP synthase membrane subunit b/b'